MKKDIILAGVGGQGLLSIAAVIGEAALKNGLFIKQSEVHGMAQRGGVVQSHVRLSDHEIYSNLVAKGACDLILATEPLEALRHLEFLKDTGVVVTSSVPLKNVDPYPSEEQIIESINSIEHHVMIDAASLAKEAGSILCTNMVVLGAGSPFLGIPENALRAAIKNIFGRKGQKIVDTNLEGFTLGKNATKNATSKLS